MGLRVREVVVAAAHGYIQEWARVVPRLRELAPRGQRESGGGIHAT